MPLLLHSSGPTQHCPDGQNLIHDYASATMNETCKDISVPPTTPTSTPARFNRVAPFFRYGLAVVYSGIGIVILQLIHKVFPVYEPPVILLALAVILTAWQGGAGPGYFATILVALGIWGFFVPPEGFVIPHPTQTLRLLLIVASGTAVSWLAGRHHRALDLLQRSERRVRIVIDTAWLGIVEFDKDDHVTLANTYMLKLLGFPMAELLGKSIGDLAAAEGRSLVDEATKKLHDGHLPVADYETRFARHNGLPIWVHVTVAPILCEDGKFIGSIGTVENISKRKQAEEALARSNRDLEQFANIVSHDLREPLRMVEAFGGLLEQRHGEKLDGQAREYLDFITGGAKRMARLINGLLAYSRVGRGAFIASDTNTQEVVIGVLNNLRVAIDAAHATIHVGPMPVVSGNPTQLVQLFQNLVENALKYRKAEATPEISITAEKQDGHWLFKVADNGLGIDPKHHARIFELFQRLHAEEEYSGIGVGLAVCKKIVERHGGQIWVESTPGIGSSFAFILP
ncbi:MAG: ATP-binding protein [Kiritimatiellia bacterium]